MRTGDELETWERRKNAQPPRLPHRLETNVNRHQPQNSPVSWTYFQPSFFGDNMGNLFAKKNSNTAKPAAVSEQDIAILVSLISIDFSVDSSHSLHPVISRDYPY